jgi:hypothetical protein
MLGVSSGRAPLLAVRAACASAALDGRTNVSNEDVTFAARLVLGPRATRLPPSEQPADEAPPPPEEREDDNPSPEQNAEGEVKALDDVVLAAAAAAIPPDLLRVFQENGRPAGGTGPKAACNCAGSLAANGSACASVERKSPAATTATPEAARPSG